MRKSGREEGRKRGPLRQEVEILKLPWSSTSGLGTFVRSRRGGGEVRSRIGAFVANEREFTRETRRSRRVFSRLRDSSPCPQCLRGFLFQGQRPSRRASSRLRRFQEMRPQQSTSPRS